METIDDVINEMRDEVRTSRENNPDPRTRIFLSTSNMAIEEFADRIEAAYQKDVKHLSELVKAYRAQNAELKGSRKLWFNRAEELRCRCDELYAELKKEAK